ncbi:proline--tRNA ligase [Candidatus Gracilibacteria bacterium]|nr:proline--tRNA ligase [Candidatus Gracilibacteria bacterium]
MKYSQLFVKTQKELPAKEDSRNAELLLKAGFIQKEMAGVFSFLPLGLRVLNKIAHIVREEMNHVGAIEILMSVLSPKENWERTGRWNSMGVLYKLETATGKEVALSPTHEEIVTPLVQKFCRSHKDFPVCVYQVQAKFRNEPRAKSGLLRGREFLMKDAYSFHTSQEDFERYYLVQKKAYETIYNRLGIGDITYYVAASGGDFSKFSHEFQTRCETGEDTIFCIAGTKDCFNKEIAESQAPLVTYEDKSPLPMEDVKGVGIIGVEELAKYLKISVEKTTKTILFETENKGEVIAAAVRGNYDINEIKLKTIIGCKELRLATAETVKRVTGAEVGYAGILNLPKEIKVFMDDSMKGRINFEMGANKTDYHTINVNFGRDLPEPKTFYDIKVAQEGDIHPTSGKPYEVFKAIEVGNIFPLATKFSSSFNFKFTDENGKEFPILMGCYGIGISRIMGSLVEIFSDDKGMRWPMAVTPFHIYLAAIGRDDAVYDQAEKLYKDFQNVGIEVLYDDRRDKKVGPGQKFADHELMGIPARIVLSERTLEENSVEFVDRKTGNIQKIKIDDILPFVRTFLNVS